MTGSRQKLLSVASVTYPKVWGGYWWDYVYNLFKNLDVRIVVNPTTFGHYGVSHPYPNVEVVNLSGKLIVSGLGLERMFRQIWPVQVVNLEKYAKDVDFIHSVEIYSWVSRQCAEISKKLEKPLIISVWETIPNHIFNFNPPFTPNAKFVTAKAHLFIAITRRAQKYLNSLSVPDEKIRVIHHGTNTSLFHSGVREKRGSIPKILYVGRLVAHKGLLHLLKAFSLLQKDNVKCKLVICGKGPLENVVREYSTKYDIQLNGLVPHPKLPPIYRQSHIFCLPSLDLRKFGFKLWEEQFGMVLAEAMASGLPIVSTNCGAIPEVVGPENIIVPQGSVKHLYMALRSLIDDEKLRERIGQQNRKRACTLFDERIQFAKVENEILRLK